MFFMMTPEVRKQDFERFCAACLHARADDEVARETVGRHACARCDGRNRNVRSRYVALATG
jgi:hypothetical protein